MKFNLKRATCWLLLGAAYLSASQYKKTSGFEIVHSGFESFRKGVFENGGQNLYVSAKGSIQFIRQWDLNRDGYFDLVLNTTHSRMDVPDAFIYLQTDQGFHSAVSPLFELLPRYQQ